MAFDAGSQWQYKCPFRKTWVDVSPEEDTQLKDAYILSGTGSGAVASCKVGSVRFSTDFRSMIRTNLASRRSMEVRLRDGDLPFPPPPPEAGQEGPSRASRGYEDGLPSETITAAELDNLSDGRQMPHDVRKAWGQGVYEDIKMNGEFEFSMDVSDKESLGELLSWHMLSAGILPQALDNRCLVFSNKKGERAVGNREDVARMLANTGAYPIRVTYKPHPAFKFLEPNKVPEMEAQRTWLKFVKEAVAELDGDLNNVKHKHQRKTFERYLLYLEDHYYQTGDDLSDAMSAEEVIEKYPFMQKAFLLTDKTGPGLSKILRGEVDVLEYLFGS